MSKKKSHRAPGRPTEYNLNIAKEICEKISLGSNVVKVLNESDKYPSFPTWCKWKRDNDELLKLYVNSVQDKSDVELNEMDEIQQELRDNKLTPAQANVLIQTIKWKLAKFYPKMYGDKSEIDVTTKGESLNIDLSNLSKEELKAYAALQGKIEGHKE